MKYIISFLFCVTLFISSVSATIFDSYFDQFKLAHEKNTAYPIVSKFHTMIPLGDAYEFQRQWVNYLRLTHPKIGYKAGLTSPDTQRKFNTNSPVFGVLLPSKVYNNFDIIPLDSYYNLHLEAELGFVMKEDITKPIDSLYVLRTYVDSVITAVELPDVKFNARSLFQLNDLIMSNVASNSYILGQKVSIDAVDTLAIEFKHKGTVIFESSSGSVMNGQLMALQWLVNAAIQRGWPIKKGDILLTGSIGELIPAKRGRYVVNYGDESSILFEIQ